MNNRVQYEQAPWNVEHINAIYPILRGDIVDDGYWHDYGEGNQIQRYRVYNNMYFQVVVSKKDTALLRQLCLIEAIETNDDADWVIWKKEGIYVLSSPLTVTPGPFDDTRNTVDWLLKHDLGFEKHTVGMQGVAYFEAISEYEIRTAMKRLIWLEQEILSFNKQISKLSRNHWEKTTSDPNNLPNKFEPQGRKWRQSVEPM